MKVVVGILLVLLGSSAGALELPQSVYVDVNTVYDGCLTVRDGSYFDINYLGATAGVESCSLPLIHITSSNKPACPSTWLTNPGCIVYQPSLSFGTGESQSHIYVHDEHGAVFEIAPEGNGTYRVDNLAAMSNNASGVLSGQTHPKNWVFSKDGNRFTWTLGNGEKRIYSRHIRTPSPFPKIEGRSGNRRLDELIEQQVRNGWIVANSIQWFFLEQIIKPNRNYIKYTYDGSVLNKIETFNKDHQKINEVSVNWSGNHLEVSNSDDRIWTASFLPHSESQYWRHLDRLTCPGGYWETSEILDSRLRSTQKPDRRYLRLRHGTDRQTRQSVIQGMEKPCDQVVTIARECDYGRPHTSTIVDANGDLHKWQFHNTGLLKRRVDCQGRHTLLRAERYFWGKDASLSAKAILDGKDIPIQAETWHYDCHGNVERHVTYGCISGNGTVNMCIEKQKRKKPETFNPKETESHTKTFTYSDDGLNLLLTEDDGRILTKYTYAPDTNLITRKLILENGKICERHFYDYDVNAQVCLHITDDGSSVEMRNLTDVSIRTIIRTSPRRAWPGFGQPEIIETIYWNKDTGEQKERRETFVYDDHNQVIEKGVYDRDGRLRYTLYYGYDDAGRLTAETTPNGYKKAYTYDLLGNLTSATAPDGTVVTTEYDLVDRPTSSKVNDVTTKNLYDGSRLVQSTDYHGHTTDYAYKGLSYTTTHPPLPQENGAIVRSSSTETRNALGHVTSHTDADGNTTRTDTNIFGSPIQFTHPDGTIEKFEYDLRGQLTKHTHANSSYTTYVRDGFNRILQEHLYGNDGALYSSKIFTYKGPNLTHVNDNGRISKYTYDGAGRLTGENHSGRLTAYKYDSMGRKASETQGPRRTMWEYDLEDNVVSEKIYGHGDLVSYTSYEYDPMGRCTKTTIEDVVTTTQYDFLGEVIATTDPLGYTTTFDIERSNGKVVTRIDPLGQRQATTYNALGLPYQIETYSPTGELIQQSTHFYSPTQKKLAELHTVIGANAPPLTYRWTYGPGGRLETEALHDRITTHTYNSSGQLETTTKPNGTSLNHLYDPIGRLNTFSGSDLTYSYTYDTWDNITQVTDQSGLTTSRTYNDHDEIVAETLDNTLTLGRTYDGLGRVSRLALPDNSVVKYGYAGLYLKSVGRDGRTVHYLNRDGRGNILTLKLPNGTTIDRTYDQCNRVTSIASNYYSVSDLDYDPVGNLLSYTSNDPLGPCSHTYSYDPLYRLVAEDNNIYCYDSIHNRQSKDDIDYQVDQYNQVTSDGHDDLVYDDNGLLLQQGDTTFSYDALDRLIRVESPGYTVSFHHDPFNRITSSDGRDYLFDDQREIGFYLGDDLKHLRILGEGMGGEIGAAVCLYIDNDTYYPIHDIQGSTAVLLGWWGLPCDTIRYSAFGELLITPQTPNEWLFASKRYNKDLGLSLFGRRFYDPALGRFITPDPSGPAEGPNLYAYCVNSPLIYFDEYGLFWQEAGEGAVHMAYGGARTIAYAPVAAGMFAYGTLDLGRRALFEPRQLYNQFASEYRDFQSHFSAATNWNHKLGHVFDSFVPMPGIGKMLHEGRSMSWNERCQVIGENAAGIGLMYAGARACAKASSSYAPRSATPPATSVAKTTAKAPLKLNRFNEAASRLSPDGKQNIRILRGYAKSKGWEKMPNPNGGPEKWGTYDTTGKFKWNIIIKPESSMRPGLDAGSNLPRFDARLMPDGPYINPFTSEIGSYSQYSHIPLQCPQRN